MHKHPIRTTAVFLLAVSILSGCETLSKPRYIEPDNNDLPVIINTKHQSQYSKWAWERYILVAVDDAIVDYSITHKDPDKIIETTAKEQKSSTRLTEGKHDLIIDVTFNRGTKSGPFVAQIPLKLVAEKDRKYLLNGEVSGKIVKVWLEYATGEHASEIASSEYTCTGCGPLIPILMPGQNVPIFIQM
ncbi:MAG: hypothetical protein P8045_09475 [Candidatus Thiodiazotropha sp.]|jgi:hypothetical protein